MHMSHFKHTIVCLLEMIALFGCFEGMLYAYIIWNTRQYIYGIIQFLHGYLHPLYINPSIFFLPHKPYEARQLFKHVRVFFWNMIQLSANRSYMHGLYSCHITIWMSEIIMRQDKSETWSNCLQTSQIFMVFLFVSQ